MDDELGQVLHDVSQFCLRGEVVPSDLAALWKAQLDDDTELLDAFELTLLDAPDEDLFEGFRAQDGVEPPVAAAFDRMARQICWIGEIFEGSIIGYWVGEGNRTIADSPIVVCDLEGQFELGGRTLAEYLLECTDPEDDEDFNEVREALGHLGIKVNVDNHEQIWDRIEGFDDPNSLVVGYLVEERMRAN